MRLIDTLNKLEESLIAHNYKCSIDEVILKIENDLLVDKVICINDVIEYLKIPTLEREKLISALHETLKDRFRIQR